MIIPIGLSTANQRGVTGKVIMTLSFLWEILLHQSFFYINRNYFHILRRILQIFAVKCRPPALLYKWIAQSVHRWQELPTMKGGIAATVKKPDGVQPKLSEGSDANIFLKS